MKDNVKKLPLAKLYKPLAAFKWKDATRKEIKAESIASYAAKFPL